MNTEDFPTYEQCLKLKELGFKDKCLYYYDENKTIIFEIGCYPNSINQLFIYPDKGNICDAPTLAQAQKWFEKEKGLIICVSPEAVFEKTLEGDKYRHRYVHTGWLCNILMINPDKSLESGPDIEKVFLSSEEALSEGITECLKLLEDSP